MPLSEGLKAISEPVNKLLVPIASSIGTTLQDVWELVFGGFSTYVDKKRATRERCLQDFKASLVEKVAAVPPEHQQNPPLSVVGPALEASKYYFEEKELREMFANLIAAAVDNRKSDLVMPCFTEIIKQLSPQDAKNLMRFSPRIGSSLPIAKYIHRESTTSQIRTIFKHAFLPDNTGSVSSSYMDQHSRSLSLLSHLGLVEMTYSNYLSDQQAYRMFSSTPYFDYTRQTCPAGGIWKPEVEKGIASLTPLGLAFRSVCLPLDSSSGQSD